jgi:single-strand DNA-binding protein
MASLNKVILIGNLTREPELRYTSSGTAVCEFGLAVNRRFTQNGQPQEETTFVDIVVWSKSAESCGRFLSKGSQAMIEGRLKLEQWEDQQTGQRRQKLNVVAENVQFLSPKQEQAPQQGYDSRYTPPPAGDVEDDIPF